MREKIVEELGKDIASKKKMSKEYEGKVNKRIFSNIIIAIMILLYLIVLVLGSKNIESNIFVVDLKVCSIIISLASILIFERSYRTANGALCIYGIETLMLAIITLVGVYVFQIVNEKFTYAICGVAIFVPIYYLIKSIGIYNKSKRAYVKEQSDINDIVKEDLPDTVETKKRRKNIEEQMAEYNNLRRDTSEDEKLEEYDDDNEEDEEDDDDDIDYFIYANTDLRNSGYNTKKDKDEETYEEADDNVDTDIYEEADDDIDADTYEEDDDEGYEYDFDEDEEEKTIPRTENKYNFDFDDDDEEDDEYVERKVTSSTTIKKIPEIYGEQEKLEDMIEEEPKETTAPKKRGRKPKNPVVTEEETPKKKTTAKTTTTKGKSEKSTTTTKSTASKTTKAKSTTPKTEEKVSEAPKKRGRKPKNPVATEETPKKKTTTRKKKEE